MAERKVEGLSVAERKVEEFSVAERKVDEFSVAERKVQLDLSSQLEIEVPKACGTVVTFVPPVLVFSWGTAVRRVVWIVERVVWIVEKVV